MNLSIFEFEIENPIKVTNAHKIDAYVQIVIPKYKSDEAESFFYLQDFENKPGVVRKVIALPKLHYVVEVTNANKNAIVYHDELISGWPS